MSARIANRIAAVLLLVFAAGHTYGFLHARPPSEAGMAVRQAMDQVQFHVGGSTLSYGGVYVGFGLYVGAYLLFSAFLAWHLATQAADHPRSIGWLGWIFFGLQLVCLVLSCTYFSAPPMVFSVLVTFFTGWGAWQARPR
jgi:hypothetical protein